MILSRRYGFVFVKARKVGGTSLEMALSLVCKDEDDIITPITPVDERARLQMGGAPRNFAESRADELAFIEAVRNASDEELPLLAPKNTCFHNHMTLRKLSRRVDLTGLMKVGVVRSPYGMVVSSANHSIGFNRYRKTGERMIATSDEIRAAIDRMIEQNKLGQKLLSDVYREKSGKVRIFPLRQERLQDDFSNLLEALKVEEKIELPRAKAGLGLSSVEAYELLRPDQRKIIAQIFAEDISNFGDGLTDERGMSDGSDASPA